MTTLMTYEAALEATPREMIEACASHAEAFRAAKALTASAEATLKIAHEGCLKGDITLTEYHTTSKVCAQARDAQWAIECVVLAGIHHYHNDVRRAWRMACPR